jgi:elongation factor G
VDNARNARSAAGVAVTTERIRNVALLGTHGVGTTTLAEALLVRSGAVTRSGSVDQGTSVLDTEPESIKRRMSLSLNIAPFTWTAPDGREYRINLLDTPGSPDFAGSIPAALAAADLAVLVVSAVDGLDATGEHLWRAAGRQGLPRFVFVTKEDKDRADFHAVLDQLRARLDAPLVPLELPLGEARTLHGIADVLSESAIEYDDRGHRDVASGELPADIRDEEHSLHDTVVEEIVSGDDEQLERYLAGDTPSVADLERTLRHEVLDGTAVPVLLGSATTGVGVDRLADFLCELGPSPLDRPRRVIAGETVVDVPADVEAAPLLHVVATIADPFVGQLSVFRVLSGRVHTDDHLVNSRTGTDERLHGLFALRGKEQLAVGDVIAGDLAAVARLSSVRTFDTLSPKGTPVRVPVPDLPAPQHAVAIVPRTQTDDDKLGGALAKLTIDDPVLEIVRDDETHQTLLRGLGDTHVAVAIERLERLYGVRVDTEPIRIAYRETIAAPVEVEGKVKKQSGGHGQFAVANLRVSPLARGAGVEFVDAVVGGAIPRNLIPAVAKGVDDAATTGGPHGFPVVDIQVECVDGKYHSVDSSEMAFRTAAALGVREALTRAGSVVLEPVHEVHVAVPCELQGDVMSDITARRGRLLGTADAATEAATDGGRNVIVVAHVPARELVSYAIDLRSITGGRGSFTARFDHDDVLPDALVATLKRT